MAPLKVCAEHNCNNVFETSGAQKYCSDKCRQRAYRNRNRKVPFDGWYVERRCLNCGKKFQSILGKRVYCKDACKQQHYRERIKLSKES